MEWISSQTGIVLHDGIGSSKRHEGHYNWWRRFEMRLKFLEARSWGDPALTSGKTAEVVLGARIKFSRGTLARVLVLVLGRARSLTA